MPHIALVGQQRTGSTALRQCLASAPGYFDLGEIFSVESTQLAANWWTFVTGTARDHPAAACPASWREVWQEYLRAQRSRVDATHFVIDLKVGAFATTVLSNPDGQWFFFPTDDVKFIFITRRNLMAQVVSRLRAEITAEWAQRDESADPQMLRQHNLSFQNTVGGGVMA